MADDVDLWVPSHSEPRSPIDQALATTYTETTFDPIRVKPELIDTHTSVIDEQVKPLLPLLQPIRHLSDILQIPKIAFHKGNIDPSLESFVLACLALDGLDGFFAMLGFAREDDDACAGEGEGFGGFVADSGSAACDDRNLSDSNKVSMGVDGR